MFAVGFAMWRVSRATTFQFFGEIVPRVETTERVVALTFDDGPTPGKTDEILSVLAAKDVRATFFVTGRELAAHPDEARKIVAAHHELGNHSYSHQRLIFKSPSFIADEIESTDRLIKTTGYAGEIHFRPPYGKKLFGLPYYLSRTNRKTIMWDVAPETGDADDDSDRIIAHVLENAAPGSIILLHVMYDSRAASMRAVPGIIDGLRSSGYNFKTVSELTSAK